MGAGSTTLMASSARIRPAGAGRKPDDQARHPGGRGKPGLPCRMEELKNLAALGLVLPGPAYLAGTIVFGILGYVAVNAGL